MIKVADAEELGRALTIAVPGETISLSSGIYRLKSRIKTRGLKLVGAGRDKTKIVWGDYAKMKDKNDNEYTTFKSYTLAVCADSVYMKDLTIENDAGHPELFGQEVALSVYGDNFCMEDCAVISTQDTLFAGPLPEDLKKRYEGFLDDDLRLLSSSSQSYKNCIIAGSVDFIFGCADAVFSDCEILSVADARGIGYVAAPAHAEYQDKGFLFDHCSFTKEKGVANASIYLARPWRDYGLCVFADCTYESHICPAGFDKWNDTDRDKTARFFEAPLPKSRVDWAKTF